MAKIDYKRVKCPKCGKSYFRVKENNGFDVSLSVFTTKPDPIYKDGKLQNPTEVEPIKVRCECLECGCNFRVETYPVDNFSKALRDIDNLKRELKTVKERLMELEEKK